MLLKRSWNSARQALVLQDGARASDCDARQVTPARVRVPLTEDAKSRIGRTMENDDRRFDVIVVGGGITGAGTARDAALRGLSCLLLEKGDFASGVTSKTTRLIHGGLRYLANFEVDLVAEALRERAILRRLAPYLIRPIPLVIPIYRETRTAGRSSPLASISTTCSLMTGTSLIILLRAGKRHLPASRA